MAVLVILLLLALPAMAAEPTDSDPNLTVLGGVELCGPLEPALAYLAPPAGTKARKRWDKSYGSPNQEDDGTAVYWIKTLPDGLKERLESQDRQPYMVALVEYDGQALKTVVLRRNSICGETGLKTMHLGGSRRVAAGLSEERSFDWSAIAVRWGGRQSHSAANRHTRSGAR